MEHVLLVALTWVAAVSAVSYVDYTGVKMPQYGGNAEYEMGRDPPMSHPSDDYHGHSPDGPASPDYKYEEEPHIKTDKPRKDLDDSVWRKSARKQRELIRPANNDISKRNKYNSDDEDDEVPKLRTNHRFPKHRSRLKTDTDVGEEDIPPRRHNKYSRDRKDVSDIDRKDYFHIDKDYIPDDKNKDFDDDIKFRDTKMRRTNRRRPRDRQFKRQQKSTLLEDYEEDLEADRQNMSDFEKEDKDSRSEEIRRQQSPERVSSARVRYHPVSEDEESRDNPTKARLVKSKQKGYDDYEDYYDMKRVNNIKNKLPTLLRRTTVRETTTNTRLLEMLMTHRRSLAPEQPPTATTLRSTTTVTTEIFVVTTTIATTYSAATKTEPNKKELSVLRDLSLAEKSRLSILKKAQRKEGMVIHSTKKPPVLLQVTSHMPTVVMVEPPSPAAPWMRAQEFAEDSPEKIEKVKSLMRRKLVAEAKSIHDLTNNWDEMICDYIDTSLLENKSVELSPTIGPSIICIQLYVFVIIL